MINILLILFFLSSIGPKQIREEELNFSVKIDFNGLRLCMRQNHIEDKTNKEIIKKINGRQYIDVTILVYAQIKKGNNLIKRCLNFLPEIKTLHHIYTEICVRNKGMKIISFKGVGKNETVQPIIFPIEDNLCPTFP